MEKHIGLIILDGWGIGDGSVSDAISNAKTPCMKEIIENYPNATLTTFGEKVGLPEGQMGNSEVGHLNIGAGRIVYQELTRINKAIREKTFFDNEVLVQSIKKAISEGRKLHFMGLVSEGGVHSSQAHLHALCDLAKSLGAKDNVFIHAFTDGRDCDPKSGLDSLEKLQLHLKESIGEIATVIGRYFAMDRDNRWERVKIAYEAMVGNKGEYSSDLLKAIRTCYNEGITDEFISPIILTKEGVPIARIEEGDTVISFNFRTDRPREIVTALCQKNLPEYGMNALNIEMVTFTSYDDSFSNIKVVFGKENLSNTLGEVLSNNGKKQLRIAETEKYPHVTFFFNGGRELPFENENRILCPSPKVATYDLQPEMSAKEIMTNVIAEMKINKPHFFCLNFANPDMVGHTGNYNAIIKAVETVDNCLREIVLTASEEGYELIIIADHGNADYALNPDGTPNTAHSINPVPVVLITADSEITLRDGILADVAPTILDILKIKKPIEMTGVSLIN